MMWDNSRDKVATGLVAFIRGLLGAKCPAFLAKHHGRRHECTRRMAHGGRHKDERTGVAWAFSDNDNPFLNRP